MVNTIEKITFNNFRYEYKVGTYFIISYKLLIPWKLKAPFAYDYIIVEYL